MRAPALLLLLVAAALLVSLASPLGAQCAMCKTALTQSPEGQRIARGFNEGILFLLAMPYLTFATVGFSFWWTRTRRAGKPAQP